MGLICDHNFTVATKSNDRFSNHESMTTASIYCSKCGKTKVMKSHIHEGEVIVKVLTLAAGIAGLGIIYAIVKLLVG